ncbi:MAG: DUF975 family protein [Prevotella sp.]
MKQNSEFRRQALSKLEGNWGTAALITIVYLLSVNIITGGGSVCLAQIGQEVSIVGNLLYILILPMSFACTVSFLNLARGGNLSVAYLFKFFSNKKVWVMMILKTIYIALWTLLLIIPGIIKTYSYAMAEFIMLDNPDVGADEAIKISMQMMKGNKLKLFLLDLSFIGWIILALLTFGLGMILLTPYIYTAHAEFYIDLKAETTAEPVTIAE